MKFYNKTNFFSWFSYIKQLSIRNLTMEVDFSLMVKLLHKFRIKLNSNLQWKKKRESVKWWEIMRGRENECVKWIKASHIIMYEGLLVILLFLLEFLVRLMKEYN